MLLESDTVQISRMVPTKHFILFLVFIINQAQTASELDTSNEEERGLIRTPCSCTECCGCNCCTGAALHFLSIPTKNELCSSLKYAPETSLLTVGILWNQKVVYENQISGRSPPPICLPIPRVTQVRACVRFDNVKWTRSSIELCPVIETSLPRNRTNERHFKCIKLGNPELPPTPQIESNTITNETVNVENQKTDPNEMGEITISEDITVNSNVVKIIKPIKKENNKLNIN